MLSKHRHCNPGGVNFLGLRATSKYHSKQSMVGGLPFVRGAVQAVPGFDWDGFSGEWLPLCCRRVLRARHGSWSLFWLVDACNGWSYGTSPIAYH